MLEVVIGDVHARVDLLGAALTAAGVLDARGRRREDAWVVQLGDLLDRRASPADNFAAAALAADCVDVVLAGNHEARMLRAGSPHGPALALLATRGWPHAAATSGGWLITHAGVHPDLARGLSADPCECAAEINDRWHRGRPDPLFDWVGPSRGGDAPHGGLLWLQAGEWPRGVASPWPQISGHVPQRAPRLLAPGRWSIDVRGGLAALVRDDGRAWRPVVAGARERARVAA